MKKRDWVRLIICMIIVYSVGAIGSIFTGNTVKSSWYDSIKPAITPPGWVFPIVWNILFFLIGLSLYFAWAKANKKNKLRIVLVFGFNFIVNTAWSIFYFGMRNPNLAFYDIILVWISIVAMIFITSSFSKKAAWLLVPYLVWVSFASVLNWLSIG